MRALVLVSILCASTAAAEPACLQGLPAQEANDLFVFPPLSLLSDNKPLRLSGLQPFAGEDGETLAAALSEKLADQDIHLVALPLTDRYGRPLVHLAAGETLIAETLAREGLARAAPDKGDPCGPSLRVAERDAMVKGAGLWKDRIVEAGDAPRLSGNSDTWVAVSGIVRSVRTRGRITYINFGGPGEGALTAVIFEKDKASLQRNGVETAVLRGQKVLVSGPLTQRGGPQIVISTAEQIVVLKASDGP